MANLGYQREDVDLYTQKRMLSVCWTAKESFAGSCFKQALLLPPKRQFYRVDAALRGKVFFVHDNVHAQKAYKTWDGL